MHLIEMQYAYNVTNLELFAILGVTTAFSRWEKLDQDRGHPGYRDSTDQGTV